MVLVDTREQRPWAFPPERVAVVPAALRAGDYTVAGLQDRVAIERKSLGDLVNTFFHGWLRFRKELNRLSALDVAVIAVEANIGDVYTHRYESEALPSAVLGRINGILLDHGIPTLFWGSAPEAADMAHRLLLLAWKKYR